jgi:hypothetical protein
VEQRSRKPVFQNVVDLGLRDVGIRNEPRRLAAHFGKFSAPIFALALVAAFAMCVLVGAAEADRLVIIVFAVAWLLAVFALAVRFSNRSPLVVVKVNAAGANQATWLVLAPFVVLTLGTVVLGGSTAIPSIALTVIVALVLWRGRGRLPEMLRRLRVHLVDGEPVLGDGTGLAGGARGGRDAFRLVVATDRRVLVASGNRSTERFLLLDVPYERVTRFGIEWRYWGRVGVLSLTAAGDEGTSAQTHVVTSMVPANLLSVARALQAHGVPPDDPDAVAEAEHAWEEARRRGQAPKPLFDRAAMSTRDFDRGLWLLLGLSVVIFWVDPLGLGESSGSAVAALLIAAVVCVVCGYVSGTRSSIAYIAPFNLLVVPTFFYAPAVGVIGLMIVLTGIAAIGLTAGAALRRARAARAGQTARTAARPERRASQGSLRYALGGVGLSRLSAILVASTLALVGAAAAAGFEPVMIRLALEEATRKQLPVDGRSNLTGNAASFSYVPRPGLKELITDEDWGVGPNDGARWELRSPFTEGYNVVSLAHYIFEPRLDDPATVADFVADKDSEHSRIAGSAVTHRERVVDGRKGYVWKHRARDGSWQYAAWFPRPVHSVRVECIAKRQLDRFQRLCAEAIRTLEFH